MKLIIQPDDGVAPVVQAIDKAKKTIDIVIFRFDREEIEKALHAAVGRGIVVRALIAHTNKGGDKTLRLLVLSLAFLLVSLPCMTLWALLGVGSARLLSSPQAFKRMNAALALLLLLSAWLAVLV